MLKHTTIPKQYTHDQFSKLIASRPTKLLASNSKLAKSNIHQFSIPAAEASIVKGGKLVKMKTCPMAGACLDFCYAQVGAYAFRASLVAHTRNLQFVVDAPFDFAEAMAKEILGKRNVHAIRIHDSGDFFNRAYFMVWKQVMESCPDINFYAYSKMIPMFKKLKEEGLLPKNFTVIYSFGSKADDLIDTSTDRHSKVFSSHDDMKAAGYHDTTETDANAADASKRCIGLVVHGPIVYNKKMSKAVAQHNA